MTETQLFIKRVVMVIATCCSYLICLNMFVDWGLFLDYSQQTLTLQAEVGLKLSRSNHRLMFVPLNR